MSPLLVSGRLFLLTLASKAAWLRKRSLWGLAVVESLGFGLSWALTQHSAERTVLVRVAPFFLFFAMLVIQAQYTALCALHAWLTGQVRSAWLRLARAVLLFGMAYLLIDYMSGTLA